MNRIDKSVPATQPAPSSLGGGRARASEEPGSRVDVYAAPHRALRYLLSNLLVAMGRATFGDPKEAFAILTDLETVLWAADGHIEHEDRHVRPALAERAPNATATLDGEHREHALQVAELRALATALAGAESAEARTNLGQTLYLHFSVFVAETFAHMAYEERVVQPLIDRLFTTQELLAIHAAILASIPPGDMLVWLRAMIPSANRSARAELFGMVRASAPPEVVTKLLTDLRPLLPWSDWAELDGMVEA